MIATRTKSVNFRSVKVWKNKKKQEDTVPLHFIEFEYNMGQDQLAVDKANKKIRRKQQKQVVTAKAMIDVVRSNYKANVLAHRTHANGVKHSSQMWLYLDITIPLFEKEHTQLPCHLKKMVIEDKYGQKFLEIKDLSGSRCHISTERSRIIRIKYQKVRQQTLERCDDKTCTCHPTDDAGKDDEDDDTTGSITDGSTTGTDDSDSGSNNTTCNGSNEDGNNTNGGNNGSRKAGNNGNNGSGKGGNTEQDPDMPTSSEEAEENERLMDLQIQKARDDLRRKKQRADAERRERRRQQMRLLEQEEREATLPPTVPEDEAPSAPPAGPPPAGPPAARRRRRRGRRSSSDSRASDSKNGFFANQGSYTTESMEWHGRYIKGDFKGTMTKKQSRARGTRQQDLPDSQSQLKDSWIPGQLTEDEEKRNGKKFFNADGTAKPRSNKMQKMLDALKKRKDKEAEQRKSIDAQRKM